MINIKTITITRDNDFKPNEAPEYSCDILAKYHVKGDDTYKGEISSDSLEFDNELLTEIADKILCEYRKLINEQ